MTQWGHSVQFGASIKNVHTILGFLTPFPLYTNRLLVYRYNKIHATPLLYALSITSPPSDEYRGQGIYVIKGSVSVWF